MAFGIRPAICVLLALPSQGARVQQALHDVAERTDRCTEAADVLKANWRSNTGTTVPTTALYPHQWSWDSAFIAVANARLNATRAKSELRSLFNAQWKNGMVPHIVFNPAVPFDSYFPGPNWWQSANSSAGLGPKGVETTGITNPPVHTMAVLAIANGGSPEFLEEIWPKLDAYLTYFHRDRNPSGTGLIYVRHPWENGMDNSPLWDRPLYAGIPEEALAHMPEYHRTDIHKGVDPRDRPTQAFYDRAIFMLLEARRLGYEEQEMWRQGLPFAVYDSHFNSLVLRGYEDMVEIARRLGKAEDAARYVSWAQELALAMEAMLWDEGAGVYANVNALTGERIVLRHVAGLMPLVYSTNGPKGRREHVERLLEHLGSSSFCGEVGGKCRAVPSFAVDEERFDARNYWRGPIWVNINWLLATALPRHGADAAAKWLRRSVKELVEEVGMYEYFHPFTGAPHGAPGFSWTAALYHDLFCGA